MDDRELIKALSRLLKSEIDAMHSYEQILPKIEDDIMRNRLTEFHHSREQHIEELTEMIVRMGGTPEHTKAIKGYLIEGYSVLRSLTGTKGALKAVQSIEEMTNRYYDEVVSWEIDDNVSAMLKKHFTDVKIHLDYINNNLQAL